MPFDYNDVITRNNPIPGNPQSPAEGEFDTVQYCDQDADAQGYYRFNFDVIPEFDTVQYCDQDADAQGYYVFAADPNSL